MDRDTLERVGDICVSGAVTLGLGCGAGVVADAAGVAGVAGAAGVAGVASFAMLAAGLAARLEVSGMDCPGDGAVDMDVEGERKPRVP